MNNNNTFKGRILGIEFTIDDISKTVGILLFIGVFAINLALSALAVAIIATNAVIFATTPSFWPVVWIVLASLFLINTWGEVK